MRVKQFNRTIRIFDKPFQRKSRRSEFSVVRLRVTRMVEFLKAQPGGLLAQRSMNPNIPLRQGPKDNAYLGPP